MINPILSTLMVEHNFDESHILKECDKCYYGYFISGENQHENRPNMFHGDCKECAFTIEVRELNKLADNPRLLATTGFWFRNSPKIKKEIINE